MKEDEQHADDTDKKTSDAPRLHRTDQMNAAFEIIDLPLQHLIRICLVLAVQLTKSVRQGQEICWYMQQQQRNRRKEQCRRGNIDVK